MIEVYQYQNKWLRYFENPEIHLTTSIDSTFCGAVTYFDTLYDIEFFTKNLYTQYSRYPMSVV